MSRDQSDHEFLSLLQRRAPATVQDLCDVLGITATAVRQKLMRFQASGLVDRVLAKQERGRPCHTYHLTELGLKELGDDHAEIAAILWKQMMQIPDLNIRKSVLEGVKNALVERFGDCRNGTSLASRLQLLAASLSDQGFEVEVTESDGSNPLTILREYNCPYQELTTEDSSICDLEQSVFAELLGVPVELSSCRLDGHQCCEFQVGT